LLWNINDAITLYQKITQSVNGKKRAGSSLAVNSFTLTFLSLFHVTFTASVACTRQTVEVPSMSKAGVSVAIVPLFDLSGCNGLL
jgi:hypothetical protein